MRHRLALATLVCSLTCVSAQAPAASTRSLSDRIDTTKITGAQIDETVIKTVIHVRPEPTTPTRPRLARPATQLPRGALANPAATIAEAFHLAYAQLSAGTPVKILIQPGTYRESAPVLDWSTGPARHTLLVIEAAEPGKVIWSGADRFTAWQDAGDGLYTHDWPHQFGNFIQPWGPKKVIGHRSEQVFINGWPLYQRLLETYATTGVETWGSAPVSWTYTGLLDAKTTLPPGTFGVTERPENGGKLYLRLPPGSPKPDALNIEVSVRQNLVAFGSKSNLVLRGLVFEKAANSTRSRAESPVTFVHFDAMKDTPEHKDAVSPRNVLIDASQFLWNNGTGLKFMGRDWTIRDSVFNYSGFAGLSSGEVHNLRFERNTTNFNAWRGKQAGENGWFTAGFKIHFTTGHVVLGHTAIGNQTGGIGWDIHCNDIYMQDVVSLENHAHSISWELSRGPYHGRRLLAGNVKHGGLGFFLYNASQTFLEDSILITNGLAQPNDMDAAVTSTQAVWMHNTDRKDHHALMHPLTEMGYEITGTVIASVTPSGPLIREDSWRGAPDAGYVLKYTGRDNVFWGGDKQGVAFIAPRKKTAEKARYLDAAGWHALHGEEGLRRLDPKFRDPANYDFRLATDSPLADRASRLPSYRLSGKDKADLARFQAWFDATPLPQ